MTALYPFQAIPLWQKFNIYRCFIKFSADLFQKYIATVSRIATTRRSFRFSLKKLTSVFLSLPSCNCHSNKRWYTGGMLRRYPKSNVSCCAVYQQSLSKMMHFYTNLWILKHTMKQTSGIAAVIYARLRSS